jgi:multiple sugar transport system permease protein
MDLRERQLGQGPIRVGSRAEAGPARRTGFRLTSLVSPADRPGSVGRWFLAPAVTLMVATSFFPLAYLIYLSLHGVTLLNFTRTWPVVGLENYISLIKDPEVLRITIYTFEFVIVAVLLELVLGFAMALGLNREFKGKGLFVTLMLLPFMVSPIVSGLLWKSLLSFDNGLVNQLLRLVSLQPQPWLTDQALPPIQALPAIGPWLVDHLNFKYNFVAILITDVWGATPFVFIVMLAGLHSLPREPYEAAVIDGATAWQILRYITLPLLKALIVTVVLIRAMDAMKVYASIWALFGNSRLTSTLNIHLGTLATVRFEYGRAGALSILVVLLVTTLVISFLRQRRGEQGV